MDKKLQTLLGVAVVAGVGYYLFMQSKKKSEKPASFANLVSDPVKMTGKCKGDYGKDAEGRYICCKAGWRSNQSDGQPCGGVGQIAMEEEVATMDF